LRARIKKKICELLEDEIDGLPAAQIVDNCVQELKPAPTRKNVYQSLAYELRKSTPQWERPRRGFYRLTQSSQKI
jgi:hypothetical protein